MSVSTLKISAIVVAMGATLFTHAVVAEPQQPASLLLLFNAVPKSPATIQDANTLVDWNSRTIPAITAIKTGLEAHDAAVQEIIGASQARIQTRMGGASTPEQANARLEKGAAAAGIDVARMQTDKAYAKEMQAKMKAMSPQELMAMSTAMMRGMGMRASVAVYDPPAVKAAAEAGEALSLPDQLSARTAAYQRRWSNVERMVAAIEAKFAAMMPKNPGCDGEGAGSRECVAARNRYIAAMMPLLNAREAEILTVETAALDEERAAVAEDVRKADQLLVAARYGVTSQELGNPVHIMALDQQTVGQIGALAAKFEEIVTRRAIVAHCGQKILGNCWQ